tara:strand:- start:311 stop:1051 length:741 start_codon:yes stop_codon:yes gene_type:complete
MELDTAKDTRFHLSTDVDELYGDLPDDDKEELIDLVGGIDAHNNLINKANIGLSRSSIKQIKNTIREENIYKLTEYFELLKIFFEPNSEFSKLTTKLDKTWGVLLYLLFLIYWPIEYYFKDGHSLLTVSVYLAFSIPWLIIYATPFSHFYLDPDWEMDNDEKVKILRWGAIIFLVIINYILVKFSWFMAIPRPLRLWLIDYLIFLAISPRDMSLNVLILLKRGPIEWYREAYKAWVRGRKFKESFI